MVDIAALEIKLQPQMQSSRQKTVTVQKTVTMRGLSSVLLGHTPMWPHPLPCLEVGTIHSGSDSGSSCGRWPTMSHFQARQTQEKHGDRLVANRSGDHCLNSRFWGSVLNMGASRGHIVSVACALMSLKFPQHKVRPKSLSTFGAWASLLR